MPLHKITLPTPFPVGPVNVYLADGDPLTLIDTGPRTSEAFDLLERELGARGYRYADIERIVITHTHPDHFGLVARIAERSGARVWTHPYNAEWFNELDTAMMRRGLFMLQVFNEAGVPEEISAGMTRSGARMGGMFTSVPVSDWLDEGDVIRMDNADWQVLHTPGHASGHLSFYQPDSRRMIAADHLIKHISSNPLMEAPRDYGQPRDKALKLYVESMQRVAQMDVAVAFSGHGEDITDHRGLIDQRLIFHEARMDHLLHLIGDGERTGYQLSRALFPRLSDFELFLGLSEVIGHLDILEEQGRVNAENRDGLIHYRVNG
ncbi:MAG: MBL fold metallo-hydrolase [Chloroflexi bacterium]|nr:MBL fold metallo-hydrolase [Chloroflexota bacterium]